MIRFETESGSIYRLDDAGKKWMRETATKDSGPVRTINGLVAGPMISHGPVVVGGRVGITCPPYVVGAAFRFILTSVVTKILEGGSDAT